MQLKALDTVISDFDGNPLKEERSEKPLTFRSTLVRALAHELPGEPGRPQPTGDDRFKRWSIANKIQQAGDSVELTAEEIALAKSKVGEAFLMIVVGPVWTLIESAKESV